MTSWLGVVMAAVHHLMIGGSLGPLYETIMRGYYSTEPWYHVNIWSSIDGDIHLLRCQKLIGSGRCAVSINVRIVVLRSNED